MRLFGKDVTAKKLLEVVKERLSSRGLLPPSEDAGLEQGVEARGARRLAFGGLGAQVGVGQEDDRTGRHGRAVYGEARRARQPGSGRGLRSRLLKVSESLRNHRRIHRV